MSWENPEDAALPWTLERAHWPDPMAPLVFAIAGEALAQGLTAAMQAYEYPVAGVRVQRINTYRYQAMVPPALAPEERKACARRSRERLRAVTGRLGELWQTSWLPEVRAHLAYWETFDLHGATPQALLSHLDETIARAARLWEIHFLLVLPLYRAISDFARLYRDLFGGESALEAYRLLQGFDNRTLDMGQELWQLSRKARQMPAVRAVLEERVAAAVPAALETVPEGRSFLTDLRTYLQEFGQRGTTWSIDTPSWIEEPAPVIRTLQDYLAQDDRAVLTERAVAAAEREGLVADARARLHGYPQPVIAQFEALLKAAQEATVLSEDHGFWIDFRGMYQVRRVFLEWGRRFAEDGLLSAPSDIFLLTLEELRETAVTRADRRALVALRRGEMERFRRVRPPAALGLPPPDAPTGETVSIVEEPSLTPAEPGVLQGTPGSPGHARGPARVVRSIDDMARVRQWDILVAEMTSPSWTPLFATVAAVVTATGGMLSHGAIVAREYHIPAVVGLGQAMARIQDGQLLEVDGARGIVRMGVLP